MGEDRDGHREKLRGLRIYMANTGIDLYLISGFLGAGKTTYLRDQLKNYESSKVGVLINEFGSIGIDGEIIDREGIRLVEFLNGSIFCSCLKGDFLKALIELSKTAIEVLLIENSGMADPSNMHGILTELRDKVDRNYHYRGAVCLIDSAYFLKQVQVLVPVQNQVAASNLIIINKIDKVNNETIREIEEDIHRRNPSAYLYRTIEARIPIAVLADKLSDNGFVGETSNKPWNRPASYSLEYDESCTEEQAAAFCVRMTEYTYRIKGLLKGCDGWLQVDAVDREVRITSIELRKRDPIRRSKLVLIGRNEIEFKEQLLTVWEEEFGRSPELYNDKDLCG
jgi:G3E family GTPase